MTGQQWAEAFAEVLYELRDLANDESYNQTGGKWTEFIVQKVINERMSEKADCQVVSLLSKDSEKKEESGEYLNMDAMFIANDAYKKWKGLPDYDPPVIPIAVVEHENAGTGTFEKIQYCLWKILCLRADVRVLICYQFGAKKIEELRELLENTVKNNKLAEGMNGELLLVIGDQAKDKILWKDRSDISDYFSIFQWDKSVSALAPMCQLS